MNYIDALQDQAEKLIGENGSWTAVPINPHTLLLLLDVAEAAWNYVEGLSYNPDEADSFDLMLAVKKLYSGNQQ